MNRSKFKGYAAGALMVLIALGIEHLIYRTFDPEVKRPYMLFIIPIIVASLYYSTSAGVFTSILSMVLIYFTLLTPHYSLWLREPFEAFWFCIFFFLMLLIAKIAGQVGKCRRAAEQSAAARERVLSIVSHDLRQPLSAIQLASKNALKKHPTDKWAMVSTRASTRALKLVEQLTDFIGLRSGKMQLVIERCDLSQIVQDGVNHFKEETPEACCDLKVHSHADGMWDRMRTEQVLYNLLINARKYGGNGTIFVKFYLDDDDAVISVSDQGPGIDPKFHNAIFGRFERMEDTKVPGFGLGLWICRQLVEKMGGTIRVDSEVGKGATFSIRFPKQGIPVV